MNGRITGLALAVALSGCYRLEDLVPANGSSFQLVGAPISRSSTGAMHSEVDLPTGLMPGDLLIASIAVPFSGPAPVGWEQDDVAHSGASCGADITQLHRRAEAGDTTIDLDNVVGVRPWAMVLAAYRNVGALGASLDRITADGTPVLSPYTVDLPLASSGDLALVSVFEEGAGGSSWSISQGGRLLGAADTLAVFEVRLTDPLPKQLAASGAVSSTCVMTRVQLLQP